MKLKNISQCQQVTPEATPALRCGAGHPLAAPSTSQMVGSRTHHLQAPEAKVATSDKEATLVAEDLSGLIAINNDNLHDLFYVPCTRTSKALAGDVGSVGPEVLDERDVAFDMVYDYMG